MNTLSVQFGCKSPATNQQVIDRLNEIEKLIYNPFFKAVMDDSLSYYVPPYRHKLHSIRGITVFDPDGNEVSTANQIFSDKGVSINSNVSLNNSTIIIF